MNDGTHWRRRKIKKWKKNDQSDPHERIRAKRNKPWDEEGKKTIRLTRSLREADGQERTRPAEREKKRKRPSQRKRNLKWAAAATFSAWMTITAFHARYQPVAEPGTKQNNQATPRREGKKKTENKSEQPTARNSTTFGSTLHQPNYFIYIYIYIYI